MNDASPGSDVAAIDEILQILFWLRGEGLAPDADAPCLARLTGLEEGRVERLVSRLAAQGLVTVSATGRYTLTETGAREGGRRFADEFAELTKAGHGECNDPECDCRRTGDVEDCRHRAS
jgi:hypothetical protein